MALPAAGFPARRTGLRCSRRRSLRIIRAAGSGDGPGVARYVVSRYVVCGALWRR